MQKSWSSCAKLPAAGRSCQQLGEAASSCMGEAASSWTKLPAAGRSCQQLWKAASSWAKLSTATEVAASIDFGAKDGSALTCFW